MDKLATNAIFKQGSTTYYWSSYFFPKRQREDVLRLYSFVRVVDDYVDAIPQQVDNFSVIEELWRTVTTDHTYKISPSPGDSTDMRVVKNMVYLQRKRGIEPEWVESFLRSMRMDLDGRKYRTLDDSLEYVYGSAEVIGLMMCRILGISKRAHETAKMQGRAMQWINFIRDIDEDQELDRCYFPRKALREHGLPDLSAASAKKHPEAFTSFIQSEIARYQDWQQQATRGYRYIPRRYRIPIQTAADMYNWTARKIATQPFVIFERTLKPSKYRVIGRALRNSLYV